MALLSACGKTEEAIKAATRRNGSLNVSRLLDIASFMYVGAILPKSGEPGRSELARGAVECRRLETCRRSVVGFVVTKGRDS